MSWSPAGFESVPKIGSPEEEARFGQEAAKVEAAGDDGTFKPKEGEEEAAGGDGAAKRPKPEEEAAPNSTSKRAMPEEEEEEVPNAAAKRPMPEEEEVPKPEEAAAEAGDGPIPDDWEFHEEMDRVRLWKSLLTGPKLKKKGTMKKVRIEGEAIKRLLKVRPRHVPMPEPMPYPEGFDLLPTGLRVQFISSRNKALEMWEYEQYIIDQYFEKGYAEVHRYVFDE